MSFIKNSTTKKAVITFRLHLPAQKAAPTPPVGPALGQYGLNIMDFCKRFNDQSKIFALGTPLPVVIHVYKDKSFYLEIKQPLASYLIKQYIKQEDGNKFITLQDALSVAKLKYPDLLCSSLDAACKTIIGTAKSMNIKVK